MAAIDRSRAPKLAACARRPRRPPCLYRYFPVGGSRSVRWCVNMSAVPPGGGSVRMPACASRPCHVLVDLIQVVTTRISPPHRRTPQLRFDASHSLTFTSNRRAQSLLRWRSDRSSSSRSPPWPRALRPVSSPCSVLRCCFVARVSHTWPVEGCGYTHAHSTWEGVEISTAPSTLCCIQSLTAQ